MATRTRAPQAKTPNFARAWVALQTSILTDGEFMLCSDGARLLLVLSMPLSAAQGLEGRIPADPRHLQLIVRLQDGVPACVAALQELRDAGGIVQDDPEGDPKYLYLRDWEKCQFDKGGSTTREESNRKAALRNGHNSGKHADDPRSSCELCQDGAPPVPPTSD